MILVSNDLSSRVLLSDDVCSSMAVHRQRRFWQPERGGLLFADRSHASRSEILISEATPPHSTDRSRRNSLEIAHKRCCEEIQDANRRGLLFVGYWHTHPEANPSLSQLDVTSFTKNLSDGDHGLTSFLAIVVGSSKSIHDGFACYLITNQQHERLSPLENG
ncbi:Mov34/MPN/PAD-1 family protein [Salinisphaera japonica]|uniref:Mov34/MPN/PAD-1 family protein n=1 Tax=Salinisphaera japonica TaxID=1304270 RepID=UPI003CCC89D7